MQYIQRFYDSIFPNNLESAYLFTETTNEPFIALKFGDLEYAQKRMFINELLNFIYKKSIIWCFMKYPSPTQFLKTPKMKLLKKQRDMRLFEEAFLTGNMKLIKWFIKDENFNPDIPNSWIMQILDSDNYKFIRFLCRRKIITKEFVIGHVFSMTEPMTNNLRMIRPKKKKNSEIKKEKILTKYGIYHINETARNFLMMTENAALLRYSS